MKKLILGIISISVMFGGCASTQDNIDKYIDARMQVIKNIKVVKCEKDCFKNCDLISNDIDRVDCKASCVEACHNE